MLGRSSVTNNLIETTSFLTVNNSDVTPGEASNNGAGDTISRRAALAESSPRSFYQIALSHSDDKATGPRAIEQCAQNPQQCPPARKDAKNPQCRITGHFYHNLYQLWLGPWSTDTVEEFAFLEIGFGQGRSIPVFNEFLPRAERHNMDVACQGDLSRHPKYMQELYQAEIDKGRLHCGDSSNFEFLHATYTKVFKRPGAPPLKVVIDDASHIARHMVAAVFFWLPRLEPGGLLFLEDIESNVSPKPVAHGIQSDFIPQLINDVHYCGDANKPEPDPCFPTLVNLIQSVHCDLHICVIQRNMEPASDPPKELSIPTPNALDLSMCLGKKG